MLACVRALSCVEVSDYAHPIIHQAASPPRSPNLNLIPVSVLDPLAVPVAAADQLQLGTTHAQHWGSWKELGIDCVECTHVP